ncbi:hypothetical protein DFJ73DRAFT_778832 [Zopfochytrium polystomum]|nr:hypothetical protein DFJ73DRAFT_778832 [Zopfochytrium polystomum]
MRESPEHQQQPTLPASPPPLRILIVGGGVGGLALANALHNVNLNLNLKLKRGGHGRGTDDGNGRSSPLVHVRVLERDVSPTARPLFYRLKLDSNGLRALNAILPTASFQHILQNGNQQGATSRPGVLLASNLRPLLIPLDALHLLHPRRTSGAIASSPSIPRVRKVSFGANTKEEDAGSSSATVKGSTVSRRKNLPAAVSATRALLLDALRMGLPDGTIVYGRRLVKVEEFTDAVTGASKEADLLVGADGGSSKVREWKLPHARRTDTGIVRISGRYPLPTPDEGQPATIRNVEASSTASAATATGTAAATGDGLPPVLVQNPFRIWSRATGVGMFTAQQVTRTARVLFWGLTAPRETVARALRELDEEDDEARREVQGIEGIGYDPFEMKPGRNLQNATEGGITDPVELLLQRCSGPAVAPGGGPRRGAGQPLSAGVDGGISPDLVDDELREVAGRLLWSPQRGDAGDGVSGGPWDGRILQMVKRSMGLSVMVLRSAERVGPWETTNVTLLGDAIHSMTPFRGTGANTAIEDAYDLAKCLEQYLVAAAATARRRSGQGSPQHDAKVLRGHLTRYETVLRKRGFRRVQLSLEACRMHLAVGWGGWLRDWGIWAEGGWIWCVFCAQRAWLAIAKVASRVLPRRLLR